MIKFLLQGLWRDRSRSFFPVLTVAFGVFLIVFLEAFFNGALDNMYDTMAHHNTGHVKIMTQAYAAEAEQSPNDLALLGLAEWLEILRAQYPDLVWVPRINFGGLLDIPDQYGETRLQGPAAGLAVDLRAGSPELGFLNLEKSLVRGRLPQNPGEILLAEDFAQKLQVTPGATVTLLGSTMHGSMAVNNFTLSGTLRFGVAAMDRGALIVDLRDAQDALDMQDASGVILGFFADDAYDAAQAEKLTAAFNARFRQAADEFSPVMRTLVEDSGMASYFEMASVTMFLLALVFVAVMALVLWNAGLIGGLRRYGEMGVRLAIGESKRHIYFSLLGEAALIGIGGSLIGTCFGLLLAYWLQYHGLDYGAVFKNSTLMVENVLRARVTPSCYVVGFFPGVLATFIGNALAGLGIFRRQTAQLFKELEA
ncbi:lipoprotein releasing system transmembrane protein [Candidatus Termititenax persephonae]|uniref:Lipoprotein releasing system transmembrane protein n=1 Tax=Candidatus Termititenax persephonae TaxID=2218525 RepID=A0A388TFZ1_9BACT|nr:lipoprotein releasing system transmembrane protein [Candidatus Termititenax persephonae]